MTNKVQTLDDLKKRKFNINGHGILDRQLKPVKALNGHDLMTGAQLLAMLDSARASVKSYQSVIDDITALLNSDED